MSLLNFSYEPFLRLNFSSLFCLYLCLIVVSIFGPGFMTFAPLCWFYFPLSIICCRSSPSLITGCLGVLFCQTFGMWFAFWRQLSAAGVSIYINLIFLFLMNLSTLPAYFFDYLCHRSVDINLLNRSSLLNASKFLVFPLCWVCSWSTFGDVLPTGSWGMYFFSSFRFFDALIVVLGPFGCEFMMALFGVFFCEILTFVLFIFSSSFCVSPSSSLISFKLHANMQSSTANITNPATNNTDTVSSVRNRKTSSSNNSSSNNSSSNNAESSSNSVEKKWCKILLQIFPASFFFLSFSCVSLIVSHAFISYKSHLASPRPVQSYSEYFQPSLPTRAHENAYNFTCLTGPFSLNEMEDAILKHAENSSNNVIMFAELAIPEIPKSMHENLMKLSKSLNALLILPQETETEKINRLSVVAPWLEDVWYYDKLHLVPLLEVQRKSVNHTDSIQINQTNEDSMWHALQPFYPSVCFDLDYPLVWSKFGQPGTIINPSETWGAKEFQRLHAEKAIPIALAYSQDLWRCSRNGLSFVVSDGDVIMQRFTSSYDVFKMEIPFPSTKSKINTPFMFFAQIPFLYYIFLAFSFGFTITQLTHNLKKNNQNNCISEQENTDSVNINKNKIQ